MAITGQFSTKAISAPALMTDPFWRKGRHLDEVQARILYGMATKLDGLPGTFPRGPGPVERATAGGARRGEASSDGVIRVIYPAVP